jgi:hypothetical protein
MKNLAVVMMCLLTLGYCTVGFTQAIWVEDFKDAGDGFDQGWAAPAITLGDGTPTWTSDGEIGRLEIVGSDPWAAAVVQTATFGWDTTNNQYVQIMVPNLPSGERTKVYAFSSANGFGVPYLLHSEYFAIPGQGPRPQSFDVSTLLPAGAQDMLIRLEIIDQPYGDPPVFEVDWIKAGMPASASPVPGLCGFVGPASGAEAANPPTFEWTAPTGFTGDTYTLIYGMEPASATTPVFSDDTTVTLLDGVTGTSYTPPAPLAEGNWFWTVSATNSGGMSGPFMEAGAPIGDVRDPLSRQYYWFSVVATPVEDWGDY